MASIDAWRARISDLLAQNEKIGGAARIPAGDTTSWRNRVMDLIATDASRNAALPSAIARGGIPMPVYPPRPAAGVVRTTIPRPAPAPTPRGGGVLPSIFRAATGARPAPPPPRAAPAMSAIPAAQQVVEVQPLPQEDGDAKYDGFNGSARGFHESDAYGDLEHDLGLADGY